jgi:DNA-binding transcriptional LysR family regulator
MERYVLLTRDEGNGESQIRQTISWSEAATYPLCLLTSNMQNRRILDMHFREAGAEVHAAIETNSLITLWSHIRFGHWSTVVPHSFLPLLGEMDGLAAFNLVEPSASHAVGLVASDRDPLPPVARAFFDVAKELDLTHEIARRLGQTTPSTS